MGQHYGGRSPNLRTGTWRWITFLLVGIAAGTALSAAHAEGDANALRRLAQRSQETGSDAVLVYRHGHKIFDYRSEKHTDLLDLMSCTKSIVGLAVGEAIAEGKIKSIDQPVADFYPEWHQGRKQSITKRQLLDHTSGLQHIGTGQEVYRVPDSVRLALAAELSTDPGTAFSYNNKAVNLLSGIIQVATGSSIDMFVREHFFAPMGITQWDWTKDDAGNPYAMADLKLNAEDFAKFGHLVLQHGSWAGKQLVPAAWIEQLGQQSQPYEPLYGLLWWRVPTSASGVVDDTRLAVLQQQCANPQLIQKLASLKNKQFHSPSEWHQLLAAALGPDWEDIASAVGPYGNNIPVWNYGGFDGVAAEGYLGQYLIVFPDRGLIGVRQIAPTKEYDYLRQRFEDFADLLRDLLPSGSPTE
jgi:CubicO group peptidase (beta-lactamase class C family)